MKQTVALHTLGCKLNFSETSTIGNEFLLNGFNIVDFKEKADVYVLNTCTVTQSAEKDCRQFVRKVLKQNPEAYIIVTGCYAQLRPDEIADIKGVDIVLGSNEKFKLFSLIDNFQKRNLACENLGEGEKQLADHLARVDDDLRKLEQERKQVTAERMTVAESERRLRAREEALRDRESHFKKRLDAKLDDQLRDARREIDAIIDGLKARASELTEKAGRRLRTGETVRAAGITTGDTGAAKSDARAALDQIAQRLRGDVPAGDLPPADEPLPLAPGVRVTVGGLGLEGTIIELHGKQAEIDMKGKRLRAAISDLRAIGGPSPKSQVRVNVDLQPREGMLSELNVIGCTVDDALTRVEKFLDESTVTDLSELRIVHGHGTGQLRRAIAEMLKGHPLVARYEAAPQNQGGGGATIVTLRD
jgi:dsDNA-specific endonuclease/ATPase MutS2